ncbi:hypothetical protein [Mesorhizobium sp. LjNodule214]|uniref:hypothetical protein n=1 Tax=Mesorhizobium sp. LjNodule214 TaxID=3342252 RepID=UPI003ECE2D97
MKRGVIAALIAGLGITLLSLPAFGVSGTLQVTKECSKYTGGAGSFCTITVSNCDAIPVGSKIVYAKAATEAGGLDTDIVINTPNGDTGYGHVVLDGATETGTVTLKGGTGQLAKLAGDLVVAPLAKPTYSWAGPYSY